jgi:D-alanine-D-alanine ligase
VGPNVLATAVCLNKGWTKKVLAYHGVRTPFFHIVASLEEARQIEFEYPVILKPNEEGSSVGINEDNIVRNHSELAKKLGEMLGEYKQPILAEQFIAGREFSVGILEHPGGDLEVLPAVEVDFSKMPQAGGVLGQRAKTIYDALDHYVCPADVDAETKARLERISKDIFRFLELHEFARIDFRMNDAGDIFFLEINPLPGMDFDPDAQDISFYPYMAMKAGYSYDDLIRALLESAASRYGLAR